MENLEKICAVNFPNLVTIISFYVTFSSIISCSIVLALDQSNTSFKPTHVFIFEPREPSVRRGSFSDYKSEFMRVISSRRFVRAKNANRVRRNSWNSAEKIHRTDYPDEGTNFQYSSPPNLHPTSNEKELTRRDLYLLLAEQEAKCLEEFGELEPTITFEFPQDLFRPFVCLAGSQNYSACEQCIQITRAGTWGRATFTTANCQNICHNSSALPDCAERCAEIVRSLTLRSSGTIGRHRDEKTLTTNVFCESVTQPLLQTQTASSATLTSSLASQQKDSNFRHFVYLKSVFIDGGKKTFTERENPTVFVIEQRELEDCESGSKPDVEGKWTSWKVLGKSPYGFDKIQVTYRQQTYEWRVTAVGIHGLLAVSIVKSFDTLDGYMEPGPPKHVFVMVSKPKESTVDVLLGWDPPKERACFYKIVLETRNDEESARTLRIKGEPLGVHKVWFPDLKFDSTYEVRITSRSAEWEENESTHASLTFKTPACLETHQFRFDKCAPPPPQNVSYKVGALTSSKVLDVLGSPVAPVKRYFTAHLKWEPPAHASATNLIEKYVIDVRAFSWNIRSSSKNSSESADMRSERIDPQDVLAPLQIHLPGNVTHVNVDNLDEAVEYTVLVSALSSKGSSPPVTLTIKYHSGVGFLNTSTGLWVYPCGLLVTVLMVAFGFHVMKKVRRRQQIKAARDFYFQSIDQRDVFTEDWSVATLAGDPNCTWNMLAENSFPRDKWHVGLQDLTIGDVIGQGAFGIVRKAKIRRDKYLELQKRQNGKALDAMDQISSIAGGGDETEMETVALKMLRVSATKVDREDLMKEILTMQSLGRHPQIVTLLGVCTSPNSMCLVLEYCPGGDLLSFIRKFREKYLPLLNLELGSMKGKWCENPEYQGYSNEDEFIERNSSGTAVNCQEVCYTDIHHKDFFSSSRDPLHENQAVTKQVIGTHAHLRNNGDETRKCESISEKDVLSYARQIALGMAYLERYHIIHRDLACRNILVMGDHKRVLLWNYVINERPSALISLSGRPRVALGLFRAGWTR